MTDKQFRFARTSQCYCLGQRENACSKANCTRLKSQDLQERLEHAIEITRDKQDEFASVAQAEGVSLSVGAAAVAGRGRLGGHPERADVGTGHQVAGQRAGQLLEVINEVAQPKVQQATADEIFLGPNRS